MFNKRKDSGDEKTGLRWGVRHWAICLTSNFFSKSRKCMFFFTAFYIHITSGYIHSNHLAKVFINEKNNRNNFQKAG